MTKIKYAILDEAGVLISYKKMKPKKGKLFIEVPENCDLEPEKYRWSNEEKSFIINKDLTNSMDPFAPIAMALLTIRDSRLIDFPDEVLLWMRRYE